MHFALTVTLAGRTNYETDAHLLMEWLDDLRRLNKNIEIDYVGFEIQTKLNQNNNLHFHTHVCYGCTPTLPIKPRCQFKLDKLIGVEDKKRWVEYCKKDRYLDLPNLYAETQPQGRWGLVGRWSRGYSTAKGMIKTGIKECLVVGAGLGGHCTRCNGHAPL